MMMTITTCANCEAELGGKSNNNERGGGGIDYILYSGNKNSNSSVGSVLGSELVEDAEETVSIRKALNTIFYFEETPPTIPFISDHKKGEEDRYESVSESIWDRNEEESASLELCSSCADALTLLYNAFNQFIEVCQLEGRIGRKLKDLEKLKKLKYKKCNNEEWTKNDEEDVRGVEMSSSSYPNKERELLNEWNIEGGEYKNVEFKVEFDEEIEEPSDNFFGFNDDTFVDDSDNTGVEEKAGRIPWSTLSIDSNKKSDSRPNKRRKVARTTSRSNLDEIPKEESTRDSGTKQEGAIKDLKLVITRLEDMADFKQKVSTLEDKDDESDCYIPDENDLRRSSSESEVDDDKKSVVQNRKRTTMLKSISRSIKNVNKLPIKRSRSYNSGGSFRCSECGQGFAHKKSLQRHSRVHTEDVNDIMAQCQTCFKMFCRDDQLLRHRRRVHGENIPFKNQGKTGYAERRKSQRKEPSGRKMIYSCPVCDEKFVSAEEFITHVAEDHKDVVNPWKCVKCPSEFPTLEDLSKHKTKHCNSRKRPERGYCDICMKSLYGRMHLKRHQLRFHVVRSDLPVPKESSDEEGAETEGINFNNGSQESTKNRKRSKPKPKIECTVCGKYFHRQEHLTDHLITHGIGDKYKCDECGKEFNFLRSLKNHQILHTEDNPYICPEQLCPYHEKGFLRKGHLERHLQTTHAQGKTVRARSMPFRNPEMAMPVQNPECSRTKKPKCKSDEAKKGPQVKKANRNDPEELVPCPKCDKMYRRRRLRYHMYTHEERKHECPTCGKKFIAARVLKNHIECVHENLNKFICSFCGKAFKQATDFRDHEKDHTQSERRFVCDVCGRGFWHQRKLKQHMISHTDKKDFVCAICGKGFNRNDNLKAHVKSVHEGLQIRKKRPLYQ